jgi:hypothetical protein
MNKAQIYRLAGKILNPFPGPDEITGLESELSASEINWNGFVRLGSDHLVLPALYLCLRRKGLLHLLPDGLNDYLKDILALNRERNEAIIRQLGYIRNLLHPHGISFLVMKGVGNLLDSLYEDRGERMVYDIDLLTEKGKMVAAARILEENGFFTQKPFHPSALESTMHYPVLLREDFNAGVEIHASPVQFLYESAFSSVDTLFSSARKTRDGFLVMDYPDRMVHNFIHSQLMHSGHYHASVSLRDLFDLQLLAQKVDPIDVFDKWGHYPEATRGYLKLMYTTAGVRLPGKLSSTGRGNNFLKRHQITLKLSGRMLRYYHVAFSILQKYTVLPARVLWNKKARNYVFSRLLDRSWYKRHFAGIKRMFNG